MAAKDVKFAAEARERMMRGVDILANAVKITLGPEGPQRHPRKVVRRAALDQGRRDRGQGDRARGQVREHGRADAARGRLEDQRHRRRRHHDGDGAGAGHRARRPEGGRRRHEPDGSEARHRQGRARRGRGDQEAVEEGEGLGRDRPGRHHLRQWREGDRRHDRRGHAESRQRGRDHRRGSEEPRQRARSGRGHAVRPRLHLPLLHHQCREDGGRAREPVHS